LPAIAVAILCKTPIAGLCKTRLSPPLRPDECAALSACFIRHLSATIGVLAYADSVACYAVYTPIGSEDRLRSLLPDGFRLLPQSVGDLGARLFNATADLIGAGHDGAVLVNSDSPTLPLSILRDAVRAVRRGGAVVLSPALDGGYTLIGLSKPHGRLFDGIPWSTPQVHRLTLKRAREIELPVIHVPQWYDIDDEYTLCLLEAELAGEPLAFAAPGLRGADAPCTRQYLAKRRARARMRAREVVVDHRRRRGGRSKVSGNLAASLEAAFAIATTFVRLTWSLRKTRHWFCTARSVEP
jgi:rSAM/selenodomain-associated transferase 1